MVNPLLSQIVIGAVIVGIATLLGVRRLVRGQCQLQVEVREITRLKKMELAMQLRARRPAVREPAGSERDPDEILAEIEAGPYAPVHLRPDLPAEIGALRLQTPDGPVLVLNPRHRAQRRRHRHGGTYRGLAAVPALGAAWRTVTAFAQGTATLGGAAAAGIVLSPAPIIPPAMADEPPAVIETLAGRDVHLQRPVLPERPPAAPGQPLPTPSAAPPVERAEAPVPELPASPAPSREPVEVAQPLPERSLPTSLPTPSASSMPTVSPPPIPTPTRAPTPSTSPTDRFAPELDAPAVAATGEASE